ncbi:MAG: sugar phosphate isomerase/epimerase [Verrucomicrobia bacterium]|nr:sugar phosphate isomerase/epimerase [Verrucomicrobiota bacterium]
MIKTNSPRTARRDFLKSCVGATASLAAFGGLNPISTSAVEAFKRSGPPRFLLSLAAYSFREYFIHGNRSSAAAKDPARQIDMFKFVDYCADHGCHGAEVTSYYFPEDLTTEYLLKLKRHAFLRGIDISGTAVGNTFTLPKGAKRDAEIASVKKWIDRAQILGAPHIRVFAGNATAGNKEEAKKLCVEALEECGDYAGRKGVFLGIENHGGIVAEPDGLLDIIRTVKSPWIGVNLDTGNYHTDDPYGDVAKCAPYAVNVQIKVEVQPKGKPRQEADLPRLMKILRDANYQGYVALEYESKDPWKEVPEWLKRMKELM